MRAFLIRLLGGTVPDAPKTPGVPPPARVGPRPQLVPNGDCRRWGTEDGHPEDGQEVIVLTGCNLGKRGVVKKHDFRQVFVQCEPEGVGWYSGNELKRPLL